jgi:uncharacterized membrane protein
MCVFLVVIFFFKVGFVYEVTGDYTIIRPIHYMEMKASNSPQVKADLYEFYTPGQDVFSAIWLLHMTENDSKIYADETASIHVLRAYSMKIIEEKYLLSSKITIEPNAYIYLRYLNVQGLFKEGGTFSNITEISRQLNFTDKIYSDGSEIYYSLPGG